MCFNYFWRASKGNNLISESRVFHSDGTTYIKDRSMNTFYKLMENVIHQDTKIHGYAHSYPYH